VFGSGFNFKKDKNRPKKLEVEKKRPCPKIK
jgi:hypothetical protein